MPSISKTGGFTLVEVLMMLIILSILATVAVPRFVGLQGDSLAAAKRSTSNSVQSAHTIAVGELHRFPAVRELAEHLPQDQARAMSYGIQVKISGAYYVVPTYADAGCKQPTGGRDHTVRCVGSII